MKELKPDCMEAVNQVINELGAPTHSTSAVSLSDVEWADWHTLFDAVKTRLKLTVVGQLAIGQSRNPDAMEQVCAVVLECLAELEQLQSKLKNELERYQLQDQEVVDLRQAQAHAQNNSGRTEKNVGVLLIRTKADNE